MLTVPWYGSRCVRCVAPQLHTLSYTQASPSAFCNCFACTCRQCATDPAGLSQLQGVAAGLLSDLRFPHMSGNFLAAVGAHHGLLAGQPEVARWLLEAMQWGRAADAQRKEMAVSTLCCDVCV